MVPRAERSRVSLHLLDWDSRRRENTTQDGLGPCTRRPHRIRMAKRVARERGPGVPASLLQLPTGGENPAVRPCTSQREGVEDLKATVARGYHGERKANCSRGCAEDRPGARWTETKAPWMDPIRAKEEGT